MPDNFRAVLGAVACAGCVAHAVDCSAADRLPQAAAPQRDTSASERRTADELISLQEQTMLLKAELKKLDAQAQVAERAAALSRLTGTGRAGPGLDDGVDVPRVIAIEGLGRNLSATLQRADGLQFDASAGDVLPDGLRIVSVSSREVVARSRGGRIVHLRAGTAAGAAVAPLPPVAGAAGVPGLPPGNPTLSKE
ncbi:type IV pilus biogenesis protein PilP [Burkholderia ambifaria]|uniref:Type IV pilus biogenesis protein PilP n=1 Tax=Burkholderia ambifaria TaxID=152480 RepID=A0AA41E999_9BURK|nr:type IV pilus biogenesis protein PilP [Burkholderia ambifaria]MBR8130759.1 type IV pilus biogenesis protein PilP [Burkholderia ambifaria]PRD96963.1 type IV pilus biogenesis protein PilP [Burkholderia ambifaria]